MLTRRLASLLTLVAVVGLAASGCGSTSAAVTVDGESVSQHDFEEQLDVVYENEGFRSFLFEGVTQDQLRGEDDVEGSYRQEFVGAMASVQVQFMVVPEVVVDQDLSITESDRQSVIDAIDQQAPGALDDLPASVRDHFVDGLAGFDKLSSELDQDELQAVVTDALRAADVSISSRYGSWDRDTFSVTPPVGPRPAPGSESDAGTGAPGSELPSG